ncbi:hypothetical protein [Iningainema tapete]|uniref:hypothetical protein n=1 Tax=Iningainema tapete TaxID=2806730 RepID=UPI0030DA98BF
MLRKVLSDLDVIDLPKQDIHRSEYPRWASQVSERISSMNPKLMGVPLFVSLYCVQTHYSKAEARVNVQLSRQ